MWLEYNYLKISPSTNFAFSIESFSVCTSHLIYKPKMFLLIQFMSCHSTSAKMCHYHLSHQLTTCHISASKIYVTESIWSFSLQMSQLTWYKNILDTLHHLSPNNPHILDDETKKGWTYSGGPTNKSHS